MQAEAVGCGIDSLQYWHMTPRDIRAAIKGHNKRAKEDLELEMAVRNTIAWLQGKYNSFAQHDPKHYPAKPWELKKNQPEEMTTEQMQNWAKQWASQNGNILI